MAIGTLLTRFQENAHRIGHSIEILAYVESLAARWRDFYRSAPRPTLPSAIAESLTPRERSILQLIGQGRYNKKIARDFGIAPETVKSKHICETCRRETRPGGVPRPKSRLGQNSLEPRLCCMDQQPGTLLQGSVVWWLEGRARS
jgi:Bacterial regulatory proteins, luxR family